MTEGYANSVNQIESVEDMLAASLDMMMRLNLHHARRMLLANRLVGEAAKAGLLTDEDRDQWSKLDAEGLELAAQALATLERIDA